MRSAHQIAWQLDQQDYRCAYPHDDAESARLKPGDELALAYDNHGFVHLACARIGVVPQPDVAAAA